MFSKYTSIEKRYVLELINSIAQIDGTFADEEGCILAAVAYLMEIDLNLWRPNLVDISLSYSRVGEMGKNKIKDIIILLMQVSIFDGLVKDEELAMILPLAYETGITDDEMLDLGRRAFSGESFTPFDKLLVYALCVKMMEVDSVISETEKKTLSKIQEKFSLPANFIDRQLVNNIEWALNIMSAYSLKKRYKIIEYVTKVRDSDGVITDNEAKLLLQILKQLGLREFEDFVNEDQIDNQKIIDNYNSLLDANESGWELWFEFVKEIYYEESDPSMNEYLTSALENVLKLGLSIELDLYEYLEAKRILANLYFETSQYKKLNKILKEMQNLKVIPKWYWGLISRLDFNQLAHGIQVKNDRLLNIVKSYSKYGDANEIDLLRTYPKFMKTYKDYHIVKNKEYLEMSKVTKIVGLITMQTTPSKEEHVQQDAKKYGGKILILGANKGNKKDRLIEIAKNNDFYGDIEFGPDYKDMKRIGIEKYKSAYGIHCILLAQVPHSAKGIGSKSSVLKQLMSDDYPPNIPLRTKSHKLYLTDESFANAIIEARRYLLELR